MKLAQSGIALCIVILAISNYVAAFTTKQEFVDSGTCAVMAILRDKKMGYTEQEIGFIFKDPLAQKIANQGAEKKTEGRYVKNSRGIFLYAKHLGGATEIYLVLPHSLSKEDFFAYIMGMETDIKKAILPRTKALVIGTGIGYNAIKDKQKEKNVATIVFTYVRNTIDEFPMVSTLLSSEPTREDQHIVDSLLTALANSVPHQIEYKNGLEHTFDIVEFKRIKCGRTNLEAEIRRIVETVIDNTKTLKWDTKNSLAIGCIQELSSQILGGLLNPLEIWYVLIVYTGKSKGNRKQVKLPTITFLPEGEIRVTPQSKFAAAGGHVDGKIVTSDNGTNNTDPGNRVSTQDTPDTPVQQSPSDTNNSTSGLTPTETEIVDIPAASSKAFQVKQSESLGNVSPGTTNQQGNKDPINPEKKGGYEKGGTEVHPSIMGMPDLNPNIDQRKTRSAPHHRKPVANGLSQETLDKPISNLDSPPPNAEKTKPNTVEENRNTVSTLEMTPQPTFPAANVHDDGKTVINNNEPNNTDPGTRSIPIQDKPSTTVQQPSDNNNFTLQLADKSITGLPSNALTAKKTEIVDNSEALPTEFQTKHRKSQGSVSSDSTNKQCDEDGEKPRKQDDRIDVAEVQSSIVGKQDSKPEINKPKLPSSPNKPKPVAHGLSQETPEKPFLNSNSPSSNEEEVPPNTIHEGGNAVSSPEIISQPTSAARNVHGDGKTATSDNAINDTGSGSRSVTTQANSNTSEPQQISDISNSISGPAIISTKSLPAPSDAPTPMVHEIIDKPEGSPRGVQLKQTEPQIPASSAPTNQQFNEDHANAERANSDKKDGAETQSSVLELPDPKTKAVPSVRDIPEPVIHGLNPETLAKPISNSNSPPPASEEVKGLTVQKDSSTVSTLEKLPPKFKPAQPQTAGSSVRDGIVNEAQISDVTDNAKNKQEDRKGTELVFEPKSEPQTVNGSSATNVTNGLNQRNDTIKSAPSTSNSLTSGQLEQQPEVAEADEPAGSQGSLAEKFKSVKLKQSNLGPHPRQKPMPAEEFPRPSKTPLKVQFQNSFSTMSDPKNLETQEVVLRCLEKMRGYGETLKLDDHAYELAKKQTARGPKEETIAEKGYLILRANQDFGRVVAIKTALLKLDSKKLMVKGPITVNFHWRKNSSDKYNFALVLKEEFTFEDICKLKKSMVQEKILFWLAELRDKTETLESDNKVSEVAELQAKNFGDVPEENGYIIFNSELMPKDKSIKDTLQTLSNNYEFDKDGPILVAADWANKATSETDSTLLYKLTLVYTDGFLFKNNLTLTTEYQECLIKILDTKVRGVWANQSHQQEYNSITYDNTFTEVHEYVAEEVNLPFGETIVGRQGFPEYLQLFSSEPLDLSIGNYDALMNVLIHNNYPAAFYSLKKLCAGISWKVHNLHEGQKRLKLTLGFYRPSE